MKLQDVIDALKLAQRFGAGTDIPEGSRVLQISDTLATLMIEALEAEMLARSARPRPRASEMPGQGMIA